jgi:signal transduction histidine kinase/ligand-binding sensor domain-containing protein
MNHSSSERMKYSAFTLASLVFLVLSSISFLRAQERPIEFERVSIMQGLSQSDVNCILRDRQGFMWFGTQDGLNRYDGYTFTVYRHTPSDSNSISDNYITALCEDGDGNLWIGTQNGLNEFDRSRTRFRPFLLPPDSGGGHGDNFISSICGESGGSLLVGTLGGALNRLGTAGGRWSPVPYDSSGRMRAGRGGSVAVLAVAKDRAGRVWVGTRGEGLIELDRTGEILARYRHDFADGGSLSHDIVQSILEDRQGNFWIGTNHGLNRLDRGSGRFRRYPFGKDPHSVYANYIFCVYEDESGALWAGTDEGLELYDRATDRFRHIESRPEDPEALSDGAVTSIFDAGGVVWFGTKRGLNKFCRFRKKFQNYKYRPGQKQSLSDNKVWSIYCDRRGVLWVGSNGGLDAIERNSGRTVHYRHIPSDPSSLSNNSVMAILEDERGMIWLGTWGGGLNRFDRKSGTFKHFTRHTGDTLYSSDNTVVSLSEDRNDTLWLATYGGLAAFDLKKEEFLSPEPLPPGCAEIFHDPVRVVRSDSRQRIWLGMSQGLVSLDLRNRVCSLYRHQPGDPATLSDDRVLSMEEAGDGRLLIGTEGGLNLFSASTGSSTRMGVADGLPNDVVCGILEDLRGNFWISTNKGLAMVNPRTRKVRTYDMADGLQSNEFNEWASYRSPSGEMFFGGVNGLTSFFPDSLIDNPYIPPIVLTSLKFGGDGSGPGRVPPDTNELCLSYRQNSFSFEFAALDFTKSEKNQYAYMVEGFDHDWIFSGTRRYASYTNLDPGAYTLRLKGSNNDGVWNESGFSLRLSIAPPFWRTWWFRGSGILCLLSLAAAGVLSRLKVIRKRNDLLEKKIEERTKELEVINRALQTEVQERKRTESELRRLKEHLEVQVRERTAELSNTVSSLEQQAAAREIAERNLLAYQEKLQLLASDLSATEERERRRLSRSLHDSIGQTLAFCKIKLGSVQRSARLAGSDKRLREVLGMIEQSISDTRRLTLELSPPILHELGLVPAIEWLCNRIGEEHGIDFSIQDEAHPAELDADTSILLFHAVREVVVNIVKHAAASHAFIRVLRRGESLSVRVEDNGRGFDASILQDHENRHDGFGLFHIRERLHSLGGVLEIESTPGSGTHVVLTLPLHRGVEQNGGGVR